MKAIKLLVLTAVLFSFQNYAAAQTAEEQQAWMEYMTPGKVHEMIAKSDGDWTEEITFWMEPGGQPTKTSCKTTNKMIMGGRYQYSTVSGDMMGMPFEGIILLGYDNGKKIFQSIWIDNFGTGIMNMEGTYDEATNTINLKGKGYDPLTGKDLDMRQVYKVIDNNNHLIEMYCTKDGTEYKNMEMTMTRK